jgi:hypothetical protein
MKAQTIYDFANDGGCNGTDMHDFFRDYFGRPSPSGNEILPSSSGAKTFMANCLYAQAYNSPSLIDQFKSMAKKYKVKVNWPQHAIA